MCRKVSRGKVLVTESIIRRYTNSRFTRAAVIDTCSNSQAALCHFLGLMQVHISESAACPRPRSNCRLSTNEVK